jgi:sugar/nucleoside kinase (ribokinase family)
MGSSPGGVANMATALARLGLRTCLAAAFGDDKYGEYCWETLRTGEGIDLAPSRTVPGWHSPVTVSMAYEGERTMVSHGHQAPLPESALTVPPAALSSVTCLQPGHPQPWVAAAARQGSQVFADVGWDDSGRWELAALPDLEHCEAFLPNAGEAMRYARTDCPRQAARMLADRVPLVVVTMGEQGAYAADGRTGQTAEVPAIAVEALDTTGAGDVFVAGFLTGSLAGWPLADRLAFAALTASLSVQEFGGSLAAPGWPEIAAWWRQAARTGQAGGQHAFLGPLLDGEAPAVQAGPRRRAVPTLGFRQRA